MHAAKLLYPAFSHRQRTHLYTQGYSLPKGWRVGETKMKLKETRPRHGGNYEMVFEGDEVPQQVRSGPFHGKIGGA